MVKLKITIKTKQLIIPSFSFKNKKSFKQCYPNQDK